MSAGGADRPSRRRARGSLVALLSAHAISQTGNVVTAFAIPFSVLATGGTGTQVGIAAAAATAPVVLGGPLGGVVVDRVGGRRAAIAADVVSGATVLAIPVLALTVGLPFGALLALVFAGGLLDTPGQTARRVLLPDATVAAGGRLEQSVGFLDGSERLARLLGASLAGLLVAAVGPMASLFVNAGTFAVSALLTWAFVQGASRGAGAGAGAAAGAGAGAAAGAAAGPDAGAGAAAGGEAAAGAEPAPPAPRASYWSELAEGFRWVVRDPLMRVIVALVLVTNLLDAARTSSLLPLYAADRLGGAAALGLLVAVMGGAALAGNVLFGLVAHRVPRRVVFAVCFTLAGVPSSAALALGLPLPWLVASAALSGFAAGAINPILGAVQLERVPEAMRGRVFGLIGAGAWAGIPLGGLLGGVAADGIGLGPAFAIVAVVYGLVTLWPLAGGPWRAMERGSRPR
ncbi:MFS transporter [Frigoribacterium salinisoli]